MVYCKSAIHCFSSMMKKLFKASPFSSTNTGTDEVTAYPFVDPSSCQICAIKKQITVYCHSLARRTERWHTAGCLDRCLERVYQLRFAGLAGPSQPACDEQLPERVPELLAHAAVDREVQRVAHHEWEVDKCQDRVQDHIVDGNHLEVSDQGGDEFQKKSKGTNAVIRKNHCLSRS